MVSTPVSKRPASNRKRVRKVGYAQVGPTLLGFGTLARTQNPPRPLEVFITNNRSTALKWKIKAENADWLKRDSEKGSVKRHSQASVKLTPDNASLKAGIYLATLNFILDELVVIPVSVTVTITDGYQAVSTNHIGPKAPSLTAKGSSTNLVTLPITIPTGKSSATVEIVVSNPNTAKEMQLDNNTEVIWDESTGDSQVTLKPASATQGAGGTTTVSVTVSKQSKMPYTANLAFRNTYPNGNFSNQLPDTSLAITVS